jgi:hypothetical protein
MSSFSCSEGRFTLGSSFKNWEPVLIPRDEHDSVLPKEECESVPSPFLWNAVSVAAPTFSWVSTPRDTIFLKVSKNEMGV